MTINERDISTGVEQAGRPPAAVNGEPAIQLDRRGNVRRIRQRSIKLSTVRHAAMIAACALMIYPLLWMIASSIRPNDEIFSQPGLLVQNPEFGNYSQGWFALADPFGRYLINSSILVLGSIIGNLLSCSVTAYAFARINFRFKKTLFATMLVTIMIPIHVVIVPQYIIFSQLELVNTFVPLLLPKFLATDAFFIFLMVQFIRAIPRELDEAARIDGCGHAGIFFRVILPLMLPALAATAVFTFINSWNDFFGALIYLTSPEMFTVPVALRSFLDVTGTSSFGPMFAMSVVSLLPVFLAFLLGQKYLVRGIATTGIK